MPEEKAQIDSYKFFEKLSSLDLQVLVQSGSDFRINPDRVRQWTQSGGELGRKFLG